MEQSPYTSPITPDSTSMPNPSPKSSAGPVIGAIIVIVVLALGAFYFWWDSQMNATEPTPLPFIPGDETATNEQETWQPASSDSDEAADIEAELQATDLGSFEEEMEADLSASESSF